MAPVSMLGVDPGQPLHTAQAGEGAGTQGHVLQHAGDTLYCTLLCCTVSVLYWTLLYSTVLYSTALD